MKGFLKGVWQFCSYLFWPQKKPKMEEEISFSGLRRLSNLRPESSKFSYYDERGENIYRLLVDINGREVKKLKNLNR